MGAEENEMTPQVLSDLLSLVVPAVIPASVIATWTELERDWAAKWASDHDDIAQQPKPHCVRQAEELASNPALAQLAVEEWTLYLNQLQGSQRHIPDSEAMSIDAARRAVTGLLVLLGDKRPGVPEPWQSKALDILAANPTGVTPADLAALLGRAMPSREELDAWLDEGEQNGMLSQASRQVWAVSSQAMGRRM